jgi:nucleotide-binding universal stress UspA family protein
MPTKHILVPYEPSPVSYKAFKTALSIAKKNNSKVSVIMVFKHDYVYYAVGNPFFHITAEHIEAWLLSKDFKKMIKEAKSSNIEIWTDIDFSSSVDKGIMEFAKKNKVDLIVMGHRGRKGWKKTILGSISEKVERRNPPCKVLIVN